MQNVPTHQSVNLRADAPQGAKEGYLHPADVVHPAPRVPAAREQLAIADRRLTLAKNRFDAEPVEFFPRGDDGVARINPALAELKKAHAMHATASEVMAVAEAAVEAARKAATTRYTAIVACPSPLGDIAPGCPYPALQLEPNLAEARMAALVARGEVLELTEFEEGALPTVRYRVALDYSGSFLTRRRTIAEPGQPLHAGLDLPLERIEKLAALGYVTDVTAPVVPKPAPKPITADGALAQLSAARDARLAAERDGAA
jgi:hypothetical protein